MIVRGLEANKMHFKTHCFVYKKKTKWAFVLQSRHLVGLYCRFYKGDLHEDVTYQHPLFVNN